MMVKNKRHINTQNKKKKEEEKKKKQILCTLNECQLLFGRWNEECEDWKIYRSKNVNKIDTHNYTVYDFTSEKKASK